MRNTRASLAPYRRDIAADPVHVDGTPARQIARL
jgi:hypothetical protein